MPEDPDPSNAGRAFVPARLLAVWGAVFATALVVIGFVAYRELIHYERVAVRHVPAGAELAVRMDLEQVVLFEPVRKHLLPLIDVALDAAPGESGTPASALTRLRVRGGLNLALDARELVFARLPDARWLIVLGGIFDRHGVMEGIEAVLRDEGRVPLHGPSGVLILSPSGLACSQAEDGVLLLGSDAAIVERALPETGEYRGLGLSEEGAAAVVALPGWLSRFEDSGKPSVPSLRRASGRLDYGDPLELTFHLDIGDPGDIQRVPQAFARWLGAPLEGAEFVPRADWGGERAVVARAKFSQQAGAVVVTSTWARSELDRACAGLAAWLEPRWRDAGR